ncbi:MAG: hypothetical protein M1829_000371 [Trizodia sp. TS-e1964]|nr:MAG: hypothetical protein M1829_000371 [Trizodia sp. TS-e1964]
MTPIIDDSSSVFSTAFSVCRVKGKGEEHQAAISYLKAFYSFTFLVLFSSFSPDYTAIQPATSLVLASALALTSSNLGRSATELASSPSQQTILRRASEPCLLSLPGNTMSDSIIIPSRRAAQHLSAGYMASSSVSTPQASSSANSSIYSSSPAKMTSAPMATLPSSSLASSPPSPVSVASPSPSHRRRPSLLKIFLPSQSGSRTERRHPSLERRQDPVHEIIISDEEMLELLPQ